MNDNTILIICPTIGCWKGIAITEYAIMHIHDLEPITCHLCHTDLTKTAIDTWRQFLQFKNAWTHLYDAIQPSTHTNSLMDTLFDLYINRIVYNPQNQEPLPKKF